LFNEKPIISKWAADLYDQKVTETKDVEFLLSVIGQTPKRILEVCCGSGRILVPLAKAGHTVTGLDADEFMLAKITAKAEGLGSIQWRAADVLCEEWGTGFDVVVLAGNILYNIVSEMDYAKSQELLIKKAASALVPCGYVFIEYQPGGHRVTQSETASYNRDGKTVIWEGTDNDGNQGNMTLIGDNYDATTAMSSFTRRFELTLNNGEKITQDIPCQKHFAPLEQLHCWLREAGLTIEQEYGDSNGNPLTGNSRGVVIYARKADEITYVPIGKAAERKIIAWFGDGITKYDMLPNRDGCYRVAAMRGEQVVGFAAASPARWKPPLEQYGDAFIHSIEVDESFRRRGIARRLITMLEDWARDSGYRQIRAWSSFESPEALHMWYAMGYAMCPAVEPIYENGKVNGLNPGYYYAKILNLIPTK
jgi:GNAT superfamily N-acetyltransferase/SAM-dependent methyltransferase